MKRPVVWLAAVAMFSIASALLAIRQLGDRSLATVLGSGTMRIGYAVEPPYAFIGPGGEVTGQSPEVAKAVARRLGVGRIEWRLAEFQALPAELEEGRIDMVAAGMFITPERARAMAFSEPIFHVNQGLLVARGNPLDLHSYADVRDFLSARVAVLSGSVELAMFRRLGLPEERLLLVPDARAGLAAVETGQADALALSSPTIAWQAASAGLGQVEKAEPFTQPEVAVAGRTGYGAFAFRRADRALVAAWNRVQEAFLATSEFHAIMGTFGFTPGEYPGRMTTREIVGP